MKKLIISLILAANALILPVSISLAQTSEEPVHHTPGVIRGVGTHFEITDSQYLNITLSSSEEIDIKIESIPKMIILGIKASPTEESSFLTISGFSPNTTYHKYQNGYEDHTPLISDENGTISFQQNLNKENTIFIQPQKSTKFIRHSSGGDCEEFGAWDHSSMTCTLNQDLHESIEITGNGITDGVTLDGNGHSIFGEGTGAGVFISGKMVTVKNVKISNFTFGIFTKRLKSSTKIDSVTLENNTTGIKFSDSKETSILNSTITGSLEHGISIYYSNSNNISDNTISFSGKDGIYNSGTASYNIYERNIVSNNGRKGMNIGSGGRYNILRDNLVFSNPEIGIDLRGNHHLTLSGNHAFGNGGSRHIGQTNLKLDGGDMETNSVDQTNLVEGKPVYYEIGIENKVYDGIEMGSFYCKECKNIEIKNIELPNNNSRIYFEDVQDSLIENTKSSDKTLSIILSYSSNNTITHNDINMLSINYPSRNNQIYNNNFFRPSTPLIKTPEGSNLLNLDPPIGGNYWKKHEADCQDENGDGFCDSPIVFSSKSIDHYPWAKEIEHKNVEECCSSVLFLPGHQASRLYKKESDGDEDQLWEPTNRNEDVEELFLNSEGESINPNIYTRDIIDEVYGIGNIYKGFIGSMDDFVEEKHINEWKAIPYDWRMSLEKIVTDGISMGGEAKRNVLEEIEKMAENSQTGKISIIGHSNGGLLAKEVISSLRDSGKEDLIDRLIMVGTPQLGTPKVLAGMLHGDEVNILLGLILDKKTARSFAENMTSAYNFLPSKKYFEIVQSPVIKFDSDVTEIYDFRSLYGEDITDWHELENFLLGDDGKRLEPKENDTDSPNVLRESLLSDAQALHDKLDTWQAPENMEVIQIAGWGLDTISGIKYDDCDIPFCPDKLSNLDRSLIFTEDGDETVLVPSAVQMGEKAERYYLDLNLYNSLGRFNTNRNHASILEIDPLQDFIKSIIKKDKKLTEYIYAEKPEVKDNDKRLRFRLLSPVAIHLYDREGNHTGLIKNNNSDLKLVEEKIPNSYYMEIGEKKYAGVSGDEPLNINLIGEDLGTFTFEIDQVVGRKVAKTTTFPNIPVTKNMKAHLSIDGEVEEMEVDVEGDGQIDITLDAGKQISQEELLEILKRVIDSLEIDAKVKKKLSKKVDKVIKELKKEKSKHIEKKLDQIQHQIEKYSRKKPSKKDHIPKEEAEKLIEIIEKIKTVE